MKIKGITIWEQYAEFILLGAVGVVFCIYLVSQLSSSTNAVRIDNAEMTPSEIDDRLTDKAEALSRLLRDDAPIPSEISMEKPDPMLPAFQASLGESILPSTSTTMPRVRMAVDTGSAIDVSGQAYLVPQIAAPTTPVTMQFRDGLDEVVVEANEELQDRFDAAPFDVTWVTAGTSFDVAALLEQYRTPGPDGALPVRDKWYGDRIDILDVIVEREEMRNGEWIDRQQVALLPGQTSFRSMLEEEEVDAGLRDELLAQLIRPGVQDAVVRPEFLLTRNSEWVHPAMYDMDGADGADAVLVLRRKYQAMVQQSKQKQAELERLGGSMSGGESGGSGSGGGGGPMGGGGGPMGGGGGPMGGGGGSGSSGSSKPNLSKQQRERQIKKLQRDLDRLERQIEMARTEFEALGIVVGNDDGGPDFTLGGDQDEAWIWVHDIDVVPGRIYRYRFILRLYNPFFAKTLSLVEEQHDLAESLTVDSAISEWSAPIEIDPFVRYEIARAVPAGYGTASGSMGLGQVEAKVTRFYDGQDWVRTFIVQPGDQIGGLRSVMLETEAEEDLRPPMPPSGGQRGGEESEEEGSGSEGEGGDTASEDAGSIMVDFSTGYYVLVLVPDLDLDPEEVRFGREAGVYLGPVSQDNANQALLFHHP